jgi:hypothetical protein
MILTIECPDYSKKVRIKRMVLVSVLFVSVVALNSGSVQAHSGGTDKYGCHGGSQSYHCHAGVGPSADFYEKMKVNGLDRRFTFKKALKRYSSCVTLNRVYLRGIAKRVGKLADSYQFVSRQHYLLNKHLDTNANGVACGFLENENSRIKTFLCDPLIGVIGDGLSAATAHRCAMPPQTTEEIGGGWKVELLSRTPDAGLAIRAETTWDTQPQTGEQYYLVKMRVTNLTGKTSDFPTRILGARGDSGRDYDFNDSCHSAYLGLGETLARSSTNIPNGASAEGNVCWSVLTEDAIGLKVTVTTERYCNCNMYNYIYRVIFISIE